MDEFAGLEPDFVDLLTTSLEALPIAPNLPEARVRGWRDLYLSLDRAPHRLILVPSLDDCHTLRVVTKLLRAAHEIDDPGSTLLVMVDEIVASTGEQLPFGTVWRSLAEFEERLEHEDRVAILTALIHNVRPKAVITIGSDAAWDMLARHGPVLARQTELFVGLVKPSPEASRQARPRRETRFFRQCLPIISAVYIDDAGWLEELAERHGLPLTERVKLHPLPEEESCEPVGPRPNEFAATGIAKDGGSWRDHIEVFATEPGFLAARGVNSRRDESDHRDS
jgi:hypothetical protein